MSNLKFLTHSRGHSRKQLTSLCNDVRANLGSFEKTKKLNYLSKLKNGFEKLAEQNKLVLSELWNDTAPDVENERTQTKELDACTSYDDKISEAITAIEESLRQGNNPPPSPASAPVIRAASSGLKPPKAPLPKYSGGKYESLEKFFLNLDAVLINYAYSEFEKFLLLKSCLSDRALVLIESIETDRQSYVDAKNLLEQAFASPELQKFNAVQNLLDLKLTSDKDPFVYVGEIRNIRESFAKLKIDSDYVMQFFIWQSMNEVLKNIFIQITNKNYPSLADIESNLFKAIERYQSSPKSQNNVKVKSAGLAVNVNIGSENKTTKDQNLKVCSLCSDDHPYFTCRKYKTASDKINRLKDLKGCIKCGHINHSSADCKLSLKCKLCNGSHFPSLCNAAVKSKGRDPLKSTTKNIVSGTTWTSDVNSVKVDTCVAIPTFTGLVENETVRVLRDSGCQTSLILENVANRHNLTVVTNNVNVTINGFNGSKLYKTKIVNIPFKLGDNLYNISAICVPYIKIKLELPLYGKVVSKLTKLGYSLADEMLSDQTSEIDDISMVLGAKSASCIPICTRTVGKCTEAVLLETPRGVMIEGNLGALLAELEDNPAQNSSAPPASECTLNVQCNYAIFDGNGDIRESELLKAAEEILDSKCSNILNIEPEKFDDETVELNNNLVKFVYSETKRESDGRLQMPLLWNGKVDHLLGTNQNLASNILKSNLKKLCKSAEKLTMTDAVFKGQVESGVLEPIHDVEKYLAEHPSHSFLPHMSVFRPGSQSTKCRVVYLSNICEMNRSKPRTVSHNQAIYPGPNLNKKLSTSLILLRFDKYLMCLDICKAFLNISLREVDRARLLVMWCRDASAGDFTPVVYKAARLPFGISCSPSILMLALYKLLIIDDPGDCEQLTQLRRLVYTLTYMDNVAFTTNEANDMEELLQKVIKLFESYCFPLQQFVTNLKFVQERLDKDTGNDTAETVKLFGLQWHRAEDCISAKPYRLNVEACTKRQILKSVAENFDPLNFQGPILNRARIFLHELQCEKLLNWDTELDKNYINEWRKIARQCNSSDTIKVKRFVGRRDCPYKLICFTDASRVMYGAVLYIQNLSTGRVSFLLAKNKVINKQMENKTIPALEFNAVVLGVETILDTYKELTGQDLLCPIDIRKLEVYCDSMISLNWLESYTSKLDKCHGKLSVFVKNRIERVLKLCEICPVTFKFVQGIENPADQISRPVSYNRLVRSNYYTGPKFLTTGCKNVDALEVTVPCPSLSVNTVVAEVTNKISPLFPVAKFSSFGFAVLVYSNVLKFIKLLKEKVNAKTPGKLNVENSNLYKRAKLDLIRHDQSVWFADCVNFFCSRSSKLKDIPNIVKQLNIYKDTEGILRVKCKFGDRNFGRKVCEPVLLHKRSDLTKLIILDLHKSMNHAGKYALLAELRKQLYVPQFFSTVKSILRSCTACRRFNAKPISIHQSPYREFRVSPEVVAYRTCFLDHFGSYNVKLQGEPLKVYILIITCLFTRAVNLIICRDMSVGSFLRAFQLHVHEYGMPKEIYSDSGSSLVAGANILVDFIKDPLTKNYLNEHGIREFSFEHYYKGNSALGGLVESLVKASKRLIYGSIRNNVLDYFNFEFTISEVKHLINKRPVAFKEALRDSGTVDVPSPITPEMLLRGYDLPSVNCVPDLQCTDAGADPNWEPGPGSIQSGFLKLQKVRTRMLEVYQEEFLTTLISQATDRKDRYTPKPRTPLCIGDIVLLKENFCKPSNFPLGVVEDLQVNVLGEVTGATVRKGGTGESVKRHASSLVLLLRHSESGSLGIQTSDYEETVPHKTERAAAKLAKEKIKNLC